MRAKRRNVCQICRSRKLACDGKQPACSQCTLRQIPCSGYRQEYVFVPQDAFQIEIQAVKTDGGKEALDYQKKALVKSNDNDYARPKGSPRLVLPSGTNAPLEPKCYDLEDDIQIIIRHYSPGNSNTPAESNPLHNQICGAWVEALPLLSVSIRKKQFLSSAIKTLAAALRHHERGYELSQQPEILEMYGDSLGLMGKALEEARGTFQIEHSAAIMCLAVTDIMMPKLEPGWMMHIKGVGDLAERLGPEPFSSGILHSMFMGFRPLLLISSIIQRRKTFLAREEWTTTPFRGHAGSKIQLLFNRASALPALLERYYDLVDVEVVDEVAVERLRTDFREIIESFWEWELVLHSEAASPVFWSKHNSDDSSCLDSKVLWVPNIMTANSLTHCWAFMIVARSHLSMLNGTVSAVKGNGQRAFLRGRSDSASEEPVAALAEKICDSMAYIMQPDMRLYGPGSAFFTFPTAVHVFRSEPDRYRLQLLRCEQILDHLATIGFYFPRT